MDSHVRFATSNDALELEVLATVTFPHACPPEAELADITAFVTENLSAERFSEYISRPDCVVLVYEDQDGLQGYSLTVGGEQGAPEESFGVGNPEAVYLSKMYVLPARHGGEVAAPLLEATLQACRDEFGASSVWLATNQQNERASRFYLKHGFQKVGTKQMQVGSQIHQDFVYELVL